MSSTLHDPHDVGHEQEEHDGEHEHGHHQHHGPGGHAHSDELSKASKKSLIGALVLIAGYMFAEVIGGILSGSLALIADAGHMLTGAASIGLALVATQVAHSGGPRRTHLRAASPRNSGGPAECAHALANRRMGGP